MTESGYECPECGARLVNHRCRACGWKPASLAAETKRQADPDTGRCAWEANRGRCCMAGEHSDSLTGNGRWLCAWHAAVQYQRRAIGEFSEFETWLASRTGHYCSVWSHYLPGVLWDLVHGTPIRVDPQPCELASCGFALDRLEGLPGRPSMTARQAIAAATHRLGANPPAIDSGAWREP